MQHWRDPFGATTRSFEAQEETLPPFAAITSITPLYDLPPPNSHTFSSATVHFPSQRPSARNHIRDFPSEDYRPRSLSAEPRRARRPFISEEHHDDISPVFVPVPANSVAASRYPSSHREKKEVADLLAAHSLSTDGFVSPSPSPVSPSLAAAAAAARVPDQQPAPSASSYNSSSALLNLLNRYPTTRATVAPPPPEPSRKSIADTFYQNFDPRPYQANVNARWTEDVTPSSSWIHRTLSGNDYLSPVPTESSLSVSFHTDSRTSPQFSLSETPTPSAAVLLARLRESDIGPFTPTPAATQQQQSQALNRSFYDSGNEADSLFGGHSLPYSNFLDISSLDSVLGGSREDMARSSNEWRSSFAAMRDRFGQKEEDLPPPLQLGYGGSQTLPRPNLLTKSSSSNDMQARSMLNDAVKRAAEAPEFRPVANREFGNFWTNTVRNRPVSPTPQRIPTSMTAAERLELLHESPDGSPRQQAQRRGSGEALAARRAQFLKETFRPETVRQGVTQPIHVNTEPPGHQSTAVNSHAYTNGGPNFSALDHAVQELKARAEDVQPIVMDGRRSAGLARFPIGGDLSLSPPNQRPRNQARSPSPDTISEASSSYQAPTGLPHPRPKHNIKEQLLHAGYQASLRLPGRSAPNFPVPSTGSVASRISELEKRPGTPTTLLMAGGQAYGQPPLALPTLSPGPMSPRSTVFRTKSVIHVDIGQARSPRAFQQSIGAGEVFEFPPIRLRDNAAAVNEPTISETITVPRSAAKAEFQLSSTPAQRGTSAVAATKLEKNTAIGTPAAAPGVEPSPSTKTVNGTWEDISPSRVTRPFSNSAKSNEVPPSRTEGYALVKSTVTVSGAEDVKPRTTAEANGSASTRFRIVNDKPSPIAKLEPDFYVDIQTSPRHQHHVPHSLPRPRSSLHRSAVNLPRFHYPKGRPVSAAENEAALRRVADAFLRLPNQEATLLNISSVCTAAGLPVYWKRPVFDVISGHQSRPITYNEFAQYWKSMTSSAHDEAARFVWTLTNGSRETLLRKHFDAMILDIIHSHPGLAFYREAEEFHQKYVQAVVTRIFWKANRSWTGKLSVQELRRCNFLESVGQLQEVDDINKFTDYFSYEHFYVLYCKFWEIDKDHILQITRQDLGAYNEGALTPLVIDRIFSGAVTRTASEESGEKPRRLDTIGFPEFVSLLLADEDKHNLTSIEYWFRIMDLDGDGVISLYEMDIFYEQIVAKLDECSVETMKFTDVACNLIDMIKPKLTTGFTLSDLRRTPLAPRFFNSFVNWKKFFQQETNEGERPSVRADGGEELSDWDRFCAEEYEGMIAEGDEDDVDENISVNLDDDESGRPLMHNLL